MTAQTTTARKSARKTFRPEILDASERINALSKIPANDAFRQLMESAEKIVSTVSVIGTKDARKVWESKEEAFLSAHGMTWDEALSLQESIEANPEQYATTPEKAATPSATASLPGLTAQDIEGLRKVYNENPNASIPRPIWGKVFSGACASRRAGIDFRTWAKRTSAIPRPVVADIAFRVWSLPESELVKNAPVRAAF